MPQQCWHVRYEYSCNDCHTVLGWNLYILLFNKDFLCKYFAFVLLCQFVIQSVGVKKYFLYFYFFMFQVLCTWKVWLRAIYCSKTTLKLQIMTKLWGFEFIEGGLNIRKLTKIRLLILSFYFFLGPWKRESVQIFFPDLRKRPRWGESAGANWFTV